MRGTATVFALILALAANAEQLDLEQFNEQWGTTMRECLADPERCDQEQLDKLWEAEIENDQREQWERWRSQCADNANPEQCLREKEEESESDLWEYALIFYWVADTLPVAETGAELKYRLRAISSVSMELGMAEFQLPPRARQIVESKLDRLEKLRAIDRTAAEAYRHKLLRGETLKERLQ